MKMLSNKNFFTIFVLCLVGFTVLGCDLGSKVFDSREGSKNNPILLSVNRWERGEIRNLSDDKKDTQWFKFVATARNTRVYIKFSTMNCISVSLYDSSFDPVGSDLDVAGDASTTRYMENSVDKGKVYYIKVTGGSYHYGYSSYTGSYSIGFSDFPAKPETVVTPLSEDKWESGKIEAESNGGTGEQWFKFVATSSTQRIYVKFSTMNCIAAELLDSNFDPV